MTAREMQIEFERRLALMNPELANGEKPDSDTIFSFLNAYTLRFVQQAFDVEDSTEYNTRVQKRSIGLLSSLFVRMPLTECKDDVAFIEDSVVVYELPKDYLSFVRCTSNACQYYDGNLTASSKNVPVKLIKQEDVDHVLYTIHNKAILPYPYATVYTNSVMNSDYEYVALDTPQLTVYVDRYTRVHSVMLTYCRKPKRFDVLNVDNKEVLDHCELPESVHTAIVDGAVEMFIAEAKYRLRANTKEQENN